MISSTSSSDRAPRPEMVSNAGQHTARPFAPRADKISTANAAFLRAELQRQPEIRPEVVERARQLAADPNYPPPGIMKKIAAQILSAPDLSEDQS